MSSSLVGRTLGAYEILELIGQGGMATVYKAFQKSIGRHVAVKVLPPHPGLNEQFISRFELEAKTIGALQHPHILPLYDYGREDDILYLVMAYVDGGSLEERIKQGAMDVDDVNKWLREIASALDYAHRQGIIHRDIKPGNILLDAEGHALLADFGIVKMVGGEGNLTGSGVIVYEMLTGRQPYNAATPMKILLKHISDPVPNILQARPDLPPALGAVMERVLAKEPQARYQSAVEFAEDFSRAVGGKPTQVAASHPSDAPTMLPTTQSPSAQAPATVIVHHSPWNNPLVLMAMFGVIAVVVVVVAVVLMNANDNQPPPTVSLAASATPVAQQAAVPTVTPPPTVPPAPTFGQVSFASADSLGDTINVQLQELSPPTAGYTAWLLNTATQEQLRLGELTIDALGNGVFNYTDAEGRMLPASFNAFVVIDGDAAPDDLFAAAAYRAAVPVELAQALYAIFVADEQGINGVGLLESLAIEANFAHDHAGFALNSAERGSLGGVKTHSEHLMNILNGEEVDYNGNGRGENPGRGEGVYKFIDLINTYVFDAIGAENADLALQVNAENILICAENLRLWADETKAYFQPALDATETVDAATLAENLQAGVLALEHMLNGFDANENGRIDPTEGECGVAQIDEFSLLVSVMHIVEGERGDE